MKFVTRRARSSSGREEAELHRPVADASKCDILELNSMKGSDFDDFDSFDTEGLLTGSQERSWIWFGLIVSLAIHFALCAYFYRTRFAPTEAAFVQNEQTPMFKVRSITESNVDKSSADQTNPAAKPNPDNTDVQLPDEKKSFDKLLQDIQGSAALPDDMR